MLLESHTDGWAKLMDGMTLIICTFHSHRLARLMTFAYRNRAMMEIELLLGLQIEAHLFCVLVGPSAIGICI